MAVSTQGGEAVDYRYFACDLMTGELLAEIPFKSVSYSRSLTEAGNFLAILPSLKIPTN